MTKYPDGAHWALKVERMIRVVHKKGDNMTDCHIYSIIGGLHGVF